MKQPKLIAITGPSASGKTKLAIETAKELNGEIISVDSRQIYKELNIGSAKPSIEEQESIVHHLLDIVSIKDEFTAADFCDIAKQKIDEIISKGKVPVLAGGTGLYFRILLQDFDLPRVAPDKKLREKLEQKTSEELYSMLKDYDKVSAEKIHFNNKVKIIRALEVCFTLNIPMSQAQKKKENPYCVDWYGLNSENRDFLYNRINLRCEKMIENGLIEEVKHLFDKYGENNILLNTIGYQEFYPYLKGEIDINEAVEILKQNTRRYAKRQISWFKANKDIHWFDIEHTEIEKIKDYITNHYYLDKL